MREKYEKVKKQRDNYERINIRLRFLLNEMSLRLVKMKNMMVQPPSNNNDHFAEGDGDSNTQ